MTRREGERREKGLRIAEPGAPANLARVVVVAAVRMTRSRPRGRLTGGADAVCGLAPACPPHNAQLRGGDPGKR